MERDRVKNLLLLQHVLSLLDDQSVRSALRKGVAGIEPVTEDRLKKIDQFKDSVKLSAKVSEDSYSKQLDLVMDRLSYLTDGKKKDAVKGLSYADLKDLLLSIHNNYAAIVSAGTQVPVEAEKAAEVPVTPPTAAPIMQQAVAPVPDGPAVYSFGTVDSRPDQDPAVVSIIPSFAAANGSIASQIYTNPSYSGVFVPVTGAVVPGGHILPAGQLIAAAPAHFQPQPAHSTAESTGPQCDESQQPAVEQAAFEVSNLNLNEVSQPAENEFRQKESRRNKFQSHGYRRDEKPHKNGEFHGSSNGFQRKPDRYQGNNRGLYPLSMLKLIDSI